MCRDNDHSVEKGPIPTTNKYQQRDQDNLREEHWSGSGRMKKISKENKNISLNTIIISEDNDDDSSQQCCWNNTVFTVSWPGYWLLAISTFSCQLLLLSWFTAGKLFELEAYWRPKPPYSGQIFTIRVLSYPCRIFWTNT